MSSVRVKVSTEGTSTVKALSVDAGCSLERFRAAVGQKISQQPASSWVAVCEGAALGSDAALHKALAVSLANGSALRVNIVPREPAPAAAAAAPAPPPAPPPALPPAAAAAAPPPMKAKRDKPKKKKAKLAHVSTSGGATPAPPTGATPASGLVDSGPSCKDWAPTLADRLNPKRSAFDAQLKARWGSMPAPKRARMIKRDKALQKERRSRAASIVHPFEVNEDDHCETDLRAFRDVAPLLRLLAQRLGKTEATLRIYDPYYCAGGTKRNFARLGFTR